MERAPRRLTFQNSAANRLPQPPTILFVAPSAYPLGGVATWLDYLVPGLQENWQVTIALTSGIFHNVDAYTKAHPLQAIPIPCGTGTRESRITHLARTIVKVNPQILAFVNIPDAALAADRLRADGQWSGKTVMIVHGLEPEPMVDLTVIGPSIDGVVCTNRLACELTNRFGGVPIERIYYAPYGIKVPPKQPPPATDRGAGRIKLGYVGRMEQHQKRVLDLPALAKELLRREIPFELSIAGSGPDTDLLKAKLSELPSQCVNFMGEIPQSQVERLVYTEIDILLVTSLWETGPIVAWEAMAAGVPVVSSRFVGSGLETRLRHKENCLLFPIGRTHFAADCVEELRHQSPRTAVAQNAHRYVVGNCTEQHSVAGFDAAFSNVLAGSTISTRRNPALNKLLDQKAGRLDTIFGSRTGERIRSLFQRSTPHIAPGGEWPHTFTSRHEVDGGYWNLAAQLDGVSLPEASF